MDGEQKKLPKACKRCGAEFMAEHIEIFGRQIQMQLFCPPCKPLAESEREHESRRETQSSIESTWATICPPEYRLTTESAGQTDIARMDKERPRWRKVLSWHYGKRGLLVHGEPRMGKTRAVWRLLRRVWEQNRKTIAHYTAASFDRRYRDVSGKFILTEWFNETAGAGVLFIDDLGKGKWGDNLEAQFLDLLETRCTHGRPTILTTNDAAGSLAKNFKDPMLAGSIIGRILEYCDIINL